MARIVKLWTRRVNFGTFGAMPTKSKPTPSKLAVAVTNVIRAEMGFQNVSQADIARRTEIPAGTLSRIIRGERQMDLDQFRLICQALQVPMSDVMAAAEEVVRTGQGPQTMIRRRR